MKPQYRIDTHRDYVRIGYRVHRGVQGEPLRCREFHPRWRGIHRNPRTQQERRRNAGDAHDRAYHARGRRMIVPSAWDDLCATRQGGKSWKDCTRYRRQWMANLD